METITVGHSTYVKTANSLYMYIIAINPNEKLQIAQIHYDMMYYPLTMSNPRLVELPAFIEDNYNVRIVTTELIGELQHFYIELTAKSKAIPEFPQNYFVILGKLIFDRQGSAISFGINNQPESFVTIFTEANIR